MTLPSPARWRRVQHLCDALEVLAPGERATRLAALEPDEDIRREVLDLLGAMDEEADAQHAHRPTAFPVVDLVGPPPMLGGVRILERLGAGGSGEVFRGVRTANGVDQFVAVKRFHAHRVSPDDLMRFTREQQMLARLTHPGIVRFVDGGIDEGRPFLVMELVEGRPITDYCDAQVLPLAARIRLFLRVCDAVQSAHLHLVVHLDLKPSNILVTDEGHVKLLDFGTAKLADPDLGLTRTEPLTLRYASPERLRGEPASVACDVFSLGLVFYELTAGGWPFGSYESLVSIAERAAGAGTVSSLTRVVTEEAAERCATTRERLRAALRGDLEAIAAKAVAVEPAARYPSVADLAADLRRYLDGVPVTARRPSVGYLTSKFIRRHAWEAGAAVALIVGLSAAAIYSARQSRAARAAAERAQAQNRFLTHLFTLAGIDGASRHDMTVRELLALAEERIGPTLERTPMVAADVESTLAYGYISQNAFAEARVLLDRAIGRAVVARDPAREANARAHLAYVDYVGNRIDAARSEARRALAIWTRHPSAFTPALAVDTLRQAATTLSYLDTTDPRFISYFRDAIAIASAHPDEVDASDRAQCLRGLAIAFANIESRYDDAADLLTEAAGLLRDDRTAQVQYAATLQMLGLVHRYRGRFAEDERAQREAYGLLSRLQSTDGVGPLWQRAIWASSLLGLGRIDEAYHEATAVLAAARRHYPDRGSYILWTPLISAAGAACLSGRNDECEALASEALETLGAAPPADDPRLHTARGLIGVVHARRGDDVAAEPLLTAARQAEVARGRTSAFSHLWR